MFKLVYTNRFKKDVKLLQKRGYDLNLIKEIIRQLEKTATLPANNNPHKLSGTYSSFWEAHIKTDWLIIWKVFPAENELWLTRTGTHSDLF